MKNTDMLQPTKSENTNRPSLDKIFMDVAHLFAHRSTCGRKKVGAIITLDKRIVSTGYNGPLPKAHHCSKSICDLSKPCSRSIHAETNAIIFAAREGISVIGGSMYITTSPCLNCSNLIILSGIKKVYFNEMYREGEQAIDFLLDNKIFVDVI